MSSKIPAGQLNPGDVLALSAALDDSSNNVYILDHKGRVNITGNTGFDFYQGTWFPDGQDLLVNRSYNHNTTTYVMTAEGTIKREILPEDSHRAGFDFSPDGHYLLHYAVDAGKMSGGKLYIYSLSGDSRVALDVFVYSNTVWAGDSLSAYLIDMQNETHHLKQFGLDGKLLKSTACEFLENTTYISLSPDCSKIAYVPIDEESEALLLHIADIDGSNTIKIGIHNDYETDPVWSPDGTKLAYVGVPELYAANHLYVVDAAGRNKRDLLVLDDEEYADEIYPGIPAWSKDSQQIAMKSYTVLIEEIDGEEWEIYGDALYVMNVDGSNLRRVTEPDGVIFNIDWRPAQ